MDPESTWLVVIDADTRTLARAQRVVHHVVQVLARGGVPLCVPDGHRDSTMALLAYWGDWGQPERTWERGPAPTPRWRPRPEVRSAQVVQSYRRRRLVGVQHRVVLGTLERVHQVLWACGQQRNTAFVEVRPVGRKEAPASG